VQEGFGSGVVADVINAIDDLDSKLLEPGNAYT
jgi:hypothetical protein